MDRQDDRIPRRGPPRTRESERRFGIRTTSFEAEALPPGLYVVATPIGNLRDITIRALETLAAADLVLAEDTRVTRHLLTHYGIATHTRSYHEHSPDTARDRVLERIREGEVVALVSDAGTPLVSDPGFKLVEAAIEEGLTVVPIPGASSILAGLDLAGLPSDRFFFEGFLPAKSAARRTRFAELAGIQGTLVVFESPHRLPESLADAADVLGDRPAVVTRELTKMFETARRGTLPELAAQFAEDGAPKGEIVLLIGAASDESRREEAEAGLDDALADALSTHSVKDAAALVAARTGLPKREVYARALAMTKSR